MLLDHVACCSCFCSFIAKKLLPPLCGCTCASAASSKATQAPPQRRPTGSRRLQASLHRQVKATAAINVLSRARVLISRLLASLRHAWGLGLHPLAVAPIVCYYCCVVNRTNLNRAGRVPQGDQLQSTELRPGAHPSQCGVLRLRGRRRQMHQRHARKLRLRVRAGLPAHLHALQVAHGRAPWAGAHARLRAPVADVRGARHLKTLAHTSQL